MNDTTSFALAFAAVAALLIGYMVHLERRARGIEAQLATLRAAANEKNPDMQGKPR